MNVLEQKNPAHFLKGCCWKVHCKCSLHPEFWDRNGSAEPEKEQLLRRENIHLRPHSAGVTLNLFDSQ